MQDNRVGVLTTTHNRANGVREGLMVNAMPGAPTGSIDMG